MDNIVKIGVFGTKRGKSFINAFKDVDGVKVTALCDKNTAALDSAAALCDPDVQKYTDFDEFIEKSGINAVVLTNYFHQHTPFAIKAMERGIHVLSETTPASTMAECVALCRAVERTGCKYMLAENYPFMCSCIELKRVYESGKLGPVMYAEGEYVHPMSAADSNSISPGEFHWRRWLPRTYYLTHSLAPLMHITGAMPLKVNARTSWRPEYSLERGRAVGDGHSTIMLAMDNDSVFRVAGSCCFGPHGNWYRLGCLRGGIETVRGDQSSVRLVYNSWETPEGEESRTYTAEWRELGELASKAGHGGGDFWVCYHFARYLIDDVEPFFDVYRSTAMSAVAILAWRSVLEDGTTKTVPDFSDEEQRKLWENDTATPFPTDENGMAAVSMPCSSREFKV